MLGVPTPTCPSGNLHCVEFDPLSAHLRVRCRSFSVLEHSHLLGRKQKTHPSDEVNTLHEARAFSV